MNAQFFALAFIAALNPKLLAIDLLLIENRRPRAIFVRPARPPARPAQGTSPGRRRGAGEEGKEGRLGRSGCCLSLIIIPFAFLELRPEATKAALKNAQDWLLGHARQLMAYTALILGAYLAITGLIRLT